jgi:beta-phosphoglucomutase-like phosphatase (HAD superfamily)
LAAEDVRQGKPDPEIYLTAAGLFSAEPAELVVLEDSHNGCRAAVAAGTRAVAVPGTHSAHHEFSGASLIVSSLADEQLWSLLSLSD